MNEMQWNTYPDHKPEEDMLCYVTNRKAGYHCYTCIYHAHYDYFRLYDPNINNQPPVEVTHWFQLPNAPGDE